MYTTEALAFRTDSSKELERVDITRNEVGPEDVVFDILYCGVCHTDVHMANNQGSKPTPYPFVPGHEIAGKFLLFFCDM